MKHIAKLGCATAFLAFAGLTARAQTAHPVQRVANIVSVAVEEYAKGIDANGRVIAADEYAETVGFLNDAKVAALRLPGERALATALLDSMVSAVAERKPPLVLVDLNKRFAAALGSEAALSLPTRELSVAEGRTLYES